MKYPKIQTIYKRKFSPEIKRKKSKCNPIIPEYSCEEFACIDKWLITEKIDGTNIRIFRNGEIGGRTDSASLHPGLLQYLMQVFTKEKMDEAFGDSLDVVLFGEGFGASIQKHGEKYCAIQKFLLFDVYIEGYWLNRHNVEEIAQKLGISAVPILGTWTEYEVVKYLESKPLSMVSEQERVIEGVVARTDPLMLFRKNHNPILWKLKVEDILKKGN